MSEVVSARVDDEIYRKLQVELQESNSFDNMSSFSAAILKAYVNRDGQSDLADIHVYTEDIRELLDEIDVKAEIND